MDPDIVSVPAHKKSGSISESKPTFINSESKNVYTPVLDLKYFNAPNIKSKKLNG
jgi:hypothetical protein